MKRPSIALCVLVGLCAWAAAPAFGYPLPLYWQIKFNNVEMVSNPTIGWQPWYEDANGNNELDPGENVIGSPTQTFTGLNDGIEDNWGVAQITTILDQVGSGGTATVEWADGDNGEHLAVMLWGLDVFQIDAKDTNMDNQPDQFTIYTQAADTDMNGNPVPDIDGDGAPDAGFSVWLDNDGNAGYTAYDITAGPSARTAADRYPTVTDGSLQALFTFEPGIDTLGGNALTIISSDSLTTPLTGGGAGYLDVVPGSGPMADLILQDGLVAAGGQLRDVFVQFDVRDHPDPNLTDYGWDLNSEDPGFGRAVPEPATMILMGTGLLGIGAVTRRRKKA